MKFQTLSFLAILGLALPAAFSAAPVQADILCARGNSLRPVRSTKCPKGFRLVTLDAAVGAAGAQGEQGLKGDPGPKGETGAAGPKGDQGLKGDQGPKGEPGTKGDIGAVGPSGATGAVGPTGEKGDKGDKGDNGADPALVTLYFNDPIARTFDFVRNRYGLCYTDANSQNDELGGIANCGSHMRILTGGEALLVQVGVQGGEEGAIVDLGTEADIELRYGGQIPSGFSMAPGNWFGTLNFTANNLAQFVFFNGPGRTLINLTETGQLFSPTPPIALIANHIYLLRIFDTSGFELIVKMHLLTLTADSATFRVKILRHTPR